MADPLHKPEQFRRGRRLPGQSPDEDLNLDTNFRIYGGPTYTIIEKDLVRIGDIGTGRYVEVDPNGIMLYANDTVLIELDTDGNITVGSGDERVEITADGLILYSNNTANLDLDADGTITIGQGDERIEITAAGVKLYANNTLQLNLQSDGDIVVGLGDERVQINSSGVQLYANNTLQLDLQSDGDIIVGPGDERVEITTAGVSLYGNDTKLIDVTTAGAVFVGEGTERVEITAAGVQLYANGTLQLDLQSDGDIVLGLGDERVQINSSGIQLYANNTLNLELQSDGDLIVGPAASDHVEITTAGIEMKDGSTVRGQWQTDGDLFLGRDISSPATTYITIFAQAQTYNSESMAAGDMPIGDNSASKANILWDKSAGRLLFRGGQDTKAYIDTDGAITAGAGDVILDDDGLALAAGTGTPNQLKITDGSDVIFKLYSQVDSQTSQLQIVSQGKDSSNHEGYLQLQAITDDGAAHAGVGQVYLTLDTAGDVCILSAQQLRGFKICRLSGMTTTQRNALTPVDGMMIYNTTTGKFQGQASGTWVDFH